MGKNLFRCVLVIAVLILLFGFETKGFSYALTDAYNILINNGWTVQDALGFLGTSIAGTLAMNPSLAPAAVAGALSAYILAKGTQLYDIYEQWRSIGAGIAILKPVEYSQTMSLKQVAIGEYAWSSIYYLQKYDGSRWKLEIQYMEAYNNNGVLEPNWSPVWANGTKNDIIRVLNDLGNRINAHDPAGKGILMNVAHIGYNYLLNNTNYTVSYSREVVVALESGSNIDSTLGYRVNVDPSTISEDGVNYLGDPDAFYNWFLSNYMNGVNEGTFVTPTTETYDEIRTQLQTIIDQLNNLSAGGGVSEETLNQLKTEILNTINSKFGDLNTKVDGVSSKVDDVNTKVDGVSSKVDDVNTKVDGVSSKVDDVNTKVDGVNTKVDGLNTKVDDVNTKVDGLNTKVDDVVSTIDTLTTDINEAQEQEQGFWDRLMEWLDDSLWSKLRDLLMSLYRVLVVPEDAAEIWDTTVAGWMDMVRWDDLEMPGFSVSGDTLGTYNIPLGDGVIPIKLGEYVAETGLRGLITGIVLFSMWFGFLLKLLPRFNI